MGPMKSDYNERLITLTVKTLSGFHCIEERFKRLNIIVNLCFVIVIIVDLG